MRSAAGGLWAHHQTSSLLWVGQAGSSKPPQAGPSGQAALRQIIKRGHRAPSNTSAWLPCAGHCSAAAPQQIHSFSALLLLLLLVVVVVLLWVLTGAAETACRQNSSGNSLCLHHEQHLRDSCDAGRPPGMTGTIKRFINVSPPMRCMGRRPWGKEGGGLLDRGGGCEWCDGVWWFSCGSGCAVGSCGARGPTLLRMCPGWARVMEVLRSRASWSPLTPLRCQGWC